MDSIWNAVLLSIVEGLTEFLPVSSTGHLIITGDLLDFTGEKASVFSVFIQLGAILAVVVLYWERFWGLLRPRAGRRETVFRPKDRAGQHGDACCKSYHFWLGYTPHALAPAGQPLAGSRPFGGGFAVNLAVFAAKV